MARNPTQYQAGIGDHVILFSFSSGRRFWPFKSIPLPNFPNRGAIITALIISFILGGPLIKWLKSQQGDGQPIREDGPESHPLTKKGTPTMGGLLILIAVSSATLLWADISNRYVWAVLIVTLGFGSIGFLDDYLKLTKRSPNGMSGKIKIIAEIAIACAVAWWISEITPDPLATGLAIPFFKNLLIDLGWFFILSLP